MSLYILVITYSYYIFLRNTTGKKKKKAKALELLGLTPNKLKKNQYHLNMDNQDESKAKPKKESESKTNLLSAPKKVRAHRVESISRSDLASENNKPTLIHRRTLSEHSGNWNQLRLNLKQYHSAHLCHDSKLTPLQSDGIQFIIKSDSEEMAIKQETETENEKEKEDKNENSNSMDMEHKQEIKQFAMEITNSFVTL